VRTTVLINLAAGAFLRGDRPALMEQIRALFLEAGSPAEILAVPGGQLVETAQGAVERGASLLVVGGGDGTLSAVAGLLRNTDVTMGVLPMGTYNHFARDLGIPTGLPDAVRCMRTAEVRSVDVGDVNGRCFLNNASLGAYPLIVREREAIQEVIPRPRWLATCLAAARVLRRHPLIHVKLSLPSGTVVLRTPFVFVGNNRYELDLPRISVRTCLERGELSVYTARCRTRFCIAHLAWLALRKKLDQAENFDACCTSELEADHRHRSMRVAIDGEVHHLNSPLFFRSQPRRLKVLAPEAGGAVP
jgi:diacylglycerol kinase family enzyme